MTPVNIPLGQLNDPRISPDASRVALIQGSSSSGDVWIFDLARSTLTRFSFTGTNATPIWSNDGKYIYYASNSFVPDYTTIFRRLADGSQDAEEVVKFEGIGYLKAILPDGKSAILDYQMHTSSADIIKIELRQGAQKAGVVDSKFNEFAAALSADGRWMAYQSNESGRPEIYVRNLETGSRTQISTASGEEPHWAPDGSGLYYRNANFLNFVPIQTGAVLQAGTAKTFVTDIFDLRSNSGVTFDVNRPDGRILMIRPPKDQSASTIKVVFNWFAELRRLTTAK
jgi:Tol biopolymer transport system component